MAKQLMVLEIGGDPRRHSGLIAAPRGRVAEENGSRTFVEFIATSGRSKSMPTFLPMFGLHPDE